jgi:O-antigen ligase
MSIGRRLSTLADWPVSSGRIDAPLAVDVAALVLYAAVRTTRLDGLLGAWVVMAMLLAIRWPASGLGLAAAVAVFPQSVRVGFSPSIAIVAAAAIGFAVDAASHGLPGTRMGRPLAAVLGGVAAIAAATSIALTRSLLRLDGPIAVEAAYRWIEFGAGLAFFLMVLRASALGSRRAIVLGLVGITVGLAVALLDFLNPRLLPSVGMGWTLSGSDSSRATGPFASPNRLGTVAGVTVVLGACLALMGSHRRWLPAALVALSSVVLIISFSRGALLGLALAGGALLAIRSGRVAVVYVLAVLAIAVLAVPVLVGARLTGSGGTLEALLANDQGRFDAWAAGVRMIVAEPIFGHGFHSFAALGPSFGATDGLQTAHNEFIGLWAESGVLAFAGYLLTIAGVVRGAVERRGDAWAMAALGAIVVFVVASSFNVQSMFLAVVGPVWLVVAYGIARPPAPSSLDPRSEAVEAPAEGPL